MQGQLQNLFGAMMIFFFTILGSIETSVIWKGEKHK